MILLMYLMSFSFPNTHLEQKRSLQPIIIVSDCSFLMTSAAADVQATSVTKYPNSYESITEHSANTVQYQDSKILVNLQYVVVHLNTSRPGAEIEFTVHGALHKLPKNQFKPVVQSRQKALIAYCPNKYCDYIIIKSKIDTAKIGLA